MATVKGVRLSQVARKPSGFGGFVAAAFGFLFAGSMLTIPPCSRRNSP